MLIKFSNIKHLQKIVKCVFPIEGSCTYGSLLLFVVATTDLNFTIRYLKFILPEEIKFIIEPGLNVPASFNCTIL